MSLFSHFSRARKRAQAQKILRKAVVETLESRRLLSITNFSFTGDSSVQEGHQAHFVLTADTDHDFTNPQLQVHIDFGVKDSNGIEETMDFSITPGQTNDIYGTFHEETNPSNPAHVTCSVHDDGAFTYNIGPDDRMGDLYVGVDDADLIADAGIDVPCPETPDLNGNTVTPSPVTVGHFTDTAGGDSEIGDFVATIDWGDGSTSQGQIVLASAPNYYSVIGSHAYQATDDSPDPVIGNWPISATVTDMAPNGVGGSEGGKSATINSTAKVSRGLLYNLDKAGTSPTPDGHGPALVSTVTISLSAAANDNPPRQYQDFTLFLENRATQVSKIDTGASVTSVKPVNTTHTIKAGIITTPRTGQETSLKFEVSWVGVNIQNGDQFDVVITSGDKAISTTMTVVFIP